MSAERSAVSKVTQHVYDWLVLVGLIVSSLVAFTGCNNRTELLPDLGAKESIEVVVVLNREGISAERVAQSSGRKALYRVEVFSRDLSRAFSVLSEYGYPREASASVDACMQPQGFAPTAPEMTGLRIDRALELRIEQLLTSMPGVVSATVLVRAHLAAPQSFIPTASDSEREPTASVTLRYATPDGVEPIQTAEVQRIVAQAVPGMSAENVRVDATRSSLEMSGGIPGSTELVQLPLFNFRVPREDRVRAGLNILIVVVSICLAGLVIGAAWSTRSFRKRLLTRARTASGEHSRSMFIEAQLGSSTGNLAQGGGDVGRRLAAQRSSTTES